MGSAEHEPITGVQGQSPWSGGGRSLPEAESILVIGCSTEPANLAPFQKFYVEIQGVGDPRCPFLGAPML